MTQDIDALVERQLADPEICRVEFRVQPRYVIERLAELKAEARLDDFSFGFRASKAGTWRDWTLEVLEEDDPPRLVACVGAVMLAGSGCTTRRRGKQHLSVMRQTACRSGTVADLSRHLDQGGRKYLYLLVALQPAEGLGGLLVLRSGAKPIL